MNDMPQIEISDQKMMTLKTFTFFINQHSNHIMQTVFILQTSNHTFVSVSDFVTMLVELSAGISILLASLAGIASFKGSVFPSPVGRAGILMEEAPG